MVVAAIEGRARQHWAPVQPKKVATMLQVQTQEAITPTTSADTAESRTRRTRELNDQCRQAWGVYPNTKVVFTVGVRALDGDRISVLAERVQTFNIFTEANDPHGEHDFGAFDFDGEKIFWKFDYYTPDLKGGSAEPWNPKKTCRVLTILLASEY